MSQKKRRKQRPRRTFYEPEQKHIKEWLDNQQNLSVSLQLIISDAIYRYGQGDVIEQYLLRRNVAEEFERYPDKYDQSVGINGLPKQDDKGEMTRQVVQREVEEPNHRVAMKGSDPVTSSELSSEDQVPLTTQEDPVRERPVRSTRVPAKEEVAVSEQNTQQEAKAKEVLQEEEYNPIDIMLEDIGSRFE